MYAKLRDLIGIPKKFSGDEFPRDFVFARYAECHAGHVLLGWPD